MSDIPDNLTPAEKVFNARLDVGIYGLIAAYHIIHDTEPDTPPDKDMPPGPYIPLAIRK
jgi:hypothetical protein